MSVTASGTGKLIVVAAPSGAGKTTLVRLLMKALPHLSFSVSACSRPPREGEVHGRDYYFLSPAEFRSRISAGDFIEWEEVYPGRFYGTLRDEVKRLLQAGHHVVFDVDVKGALNLKRHYGQLALIVFVRPPSPDVLEQRLRARSTDDEDSIRTRLERSRSEMVYEKEFDAVLVNDDLGRAAAELTGMVRQFLSFNTETL